MIPVTKPYLPPLAEYIPYIEKIWEKEWLTNNGPHVQKLEEELKNYLDSNNILFLGNGTIAIQIAIKALDLKGDIITTPFSYVATTSSIVWESCKPVFVDIDKATFNICTDFIEDAITPNTSAILATHVFGNPCDIDSIESIAKKHKIKVIYDAAHCFGTTYRGRSIFNYGDITTTSFHATKIYNTIEGGAVFTDDEQLFSKMGYLRNFGHDGPLKFNGVGINGKNSEFHAAMGLCNLKYIDNILITRKSQWELYYKNLENSELQLLTLTKHSTFNYSYFPIIFKSEKQLLNVEATLQKNDIFPRRYFNPSLNTLDYVEGNSCPVSEKISTTIMTLPLYHQLKEDDISWICSLIKTNL